MGDFPVVKCGDWLCLGDDAGGSIWKVEEPRGCGCPRDEAGDGDCDWALARGSDNHKEEPEWGTALRTPPKDGGSLDEEAAGKEAALGPPS